MTSFGQTGRIFVGRHREMGELRTALDESIGGHGRLAMLVGEPGIQDPYSPRIVSGGRDAWGAGPMG